jgi:pyrroline-5-carboxylate reductase
MKVGLIGAGNMARAMARGWGDPVLVSDSGSGRARALAAELGGRAASNAEVAREADLVVLCHKPYQLRQVALEVAPHARAVASVVGGTRILDLQEAYPGTPLFRLMPNTPVEVRRGVIVYSPTASAAQDGAGDDGGELERAVLELFGRLGSVVEVPDELAPVAAALTSVAPAYMALVAEAQTDAGVRHGLRADLAGRLVAETMAGSADLLAAREFDTLAVRREVTSPRGSTSRGLDALERGGVRSAFATAIDRVLSDRQAP